MIEAIEQKIDQSLKMVLVLCVASMLFLSLGTIVLRWVEQTVLWIEPLVRHLVFLLGFIGGALAIGKRQHIKIDFISKYMEMKDRKKTMLRLDIILSIVTFITLFYLMKSGIDFSKVEFEYGKAEFLKIHSGFLVSIIPFGFSVIMMRLALRLCSDMKRLYHWKS